MDFRVAFLFALGSIAVHFNIVHCIRLPRIVGGQPAKIEDLPYMVSVVNLLKHGSMYVCGGSIITPNCVLTAAHCLTNTLPENIRVTAGSALLSGGQKRFTTEKLFIHNDFNRRAFGDLDVGIVRVAKPLNEANMETILLDYSDIKDYDTVSASGWGSTIPGNIEGGAEILQTVNSTVINSFVCPVLFPTYYPKLHITENMFCTYTLKNKGVCDADSGGPVVRNGKQVGIVSFGFKICAFHPAVYTRIGSSDVSSFIERTIKDNC